MLLPMRLMKPDAVFGCAVHTEHRNVNAFELLKLTAVAVNPQHLSYSDRKASFKDLDDEYSHKLAANGFRRVDSESPVSDSITVSCVICGASSVVDLTGDPQLPRHFDKCQFQRVLESFNTAQCRSANTDEVQRHLQKEMKTGKAQAAREFGFEEDAVCTAMGIRFLRQNEGFPNAGDLVEVLLDHEENAETQPLYIIPGIAAMVAALPRRSTSTPTKLCRTEPAQESIKPLTNVASHKPDHQTLLEETQKLYRQSLCRHCHKEKASHLALPCGHVSLCDECAKQQTWCPICGNKVLELMRVYF